MEAKENKANLSRKELLAEYRLMKLKNDKQPETKMGLKKRVSSAAEVKLGHRKKLETSKTHECRPTRVTDISHKKHLTRLPQNSHHQKTENSVDVRMPKSEKTRSKNETIASVGDIFEKLREAELLASGSGIAVARSFIQSIPENSGFEQIISKAIYWLTWIKLESEFHEWDRVESLFTRANSSVVDTSDRRAISAAYESFKAQADVMLASKINSVVKIESKPKFTPKKQSGGIEYDQNSLASLLGFAEYGDEVDEGSHPESVLSVDRADLKQEKAAYRGDKDCTVAKTASDSYANTDDVRDAPQDDVNMLAIHRETKKKRKGVCFDVTEPQGMFSVSNDQTAAEEEEHRVNCRTRKATPFKQFRNIPASRC